MHVATAVVISPLYLLLNSLPNQKSTHTQPNKQKRFFLLFFSLGKKKTKKI